jgi:hypothetical protein
MRQVMVRYTVKPDRAEENRNLVQAVYQELHRVQPSGMRYVTFQCDDDVSFIHLHRSENENGAKALTELAAFKQFQAGIADRCDVRPAVVDLREIGSFRFPGGPD